MTRFHTDEVVLPGGYADHDIMQNSLDQKTARGGGARIKTLDVDRSGTDSFHCEFHTNPWTRIDSSKLGWQKKKVW